MELTRYAHLWLRPRPGTTLTLLAGMLRAILDKGLADETFIRERCDGLDELRVSLQPFALERVAQVTGVSENQVQEAARVYAAASTSAILYALDNVARDEQASHVHALADLALVTGNVGKPSSGLYALPHGTNEQGATDVGCVPDLLPGYQPVPEGPGLGIEAALQGAREGRVKAMLLLGDSASYANGELGDGYEALEHLEFLVVQDAFLGAAAQRAHVVLPAATFAEEDGTYTNLERRVQLLSKAISPKNIEAEPGWRFMCGLAQEMGTQGFDFQATAGVFDEISSVATIYGGISHQRLQREAVITLRPDPVDPQPTQLLHSDRVSRGIQWPCPDADAPGTPILYADGFPRGRVKLMPMPLEVDTSVPQADFPLLFVPGRVLAQELRDAGVVEIDGVNLIQRDELLEVHPQNAADLGIGEGDVVEVVSATERIRGVASLSETAHHGVVSMTTLFGELATRLQASEEPDPMATVPGLMVKPVRLEKVGG